MKTAALFTAVLILAGGAGWLLTSLRPASTFDSVEPRRSLHFEDIVLASGDVIFRRGRSLVSRAVLSADGGSEYSHVGIVSVHRSHVWVIHSIPAEPSSSKSGVVAEPIQMFLSAENASAAAIYRSHDPRVALSAERAAWEYARAQLPFDDAFDLSTPNTLYCTELVWRAFLTSGADLRAGLDNRAPSRQERYLLPSRLEKSPHLHLVQELKEEIQIP